MAFIAEAVADLIKLAWRHKLEILRHLLGMAQLEAEERLRLRSKEAVVRSGQDPSLLSQRHCEEHLRRSNPCLSELRDGLLRSCNDGG